MVSNTHWLKKKCVNPTFIQSLASFSYQFKLAVFELKFKILLTFSFLFDIYCVVCVAEPLYTYWSFCFIVHMSFIWWFMLHFLQIRLLQETNYRSNWSLLIFLFIIIQLFILKCDKKKKTRNKINCFLIMSFIFPKDVSLV